jgi:thioesterase domain-containing protein
LEQNVEPRFSALLLLKSGSDPIPIFIAPGGASNAQAIFPLASKIQSGHPIYAIRIWDFNGITTYKNTVEDMAQFCMNEIDKVQPQGPYLLVGYSFGGLIMLELANRLLKRGEQVAFCALLDTYPHQRYWPRTSWIKFVVQRSILHAGNLAKLPLRTAITYAAKRSRAFLEQYIRSAQNIDSTIWDTPEERLWKVALIRYTPRFYEGEVTFFKAERTTRYPKNPSSIWGKLLARLDVHTVPGDHLSMFSDHAESLAKQLSACLQKVDERIQLSNPAQM